MPNLTDIADSRALALVAIVAFVLLIGFIENRVRPRRRRGWYKRRQFHNTFSRRWFEVGRGDRNASEQLQVVMSAPFRKKQVMNRGEYRVFRVIEADIISERKGYRVFAQTCLGEVLESSVADAFHSINAKRVDILVVDQDGWPAVAVEYQGEGHHRGDAAARHAIKKEALRKAGVACIEIVPSDSDDQIRFRVRERLGWRAAVSIEGLAHRSS